MKFRKANRVIEMIRHSKGITINCQTHLRFLNRGGTQSDWNDRTCENIRRPSLNEKPISWNHTTTTMEVIVVLVSFTPCHPMSETRAKKEEKTASAIWAHGVKKSKGEQNFNWTYYHEMIAWQSMEYNLVSKWRQRAKSATIIIPITIVDFSIKVISTQ